MAGARSILLTESEVWAIEDMIRHTWSDDGRAVGRNLLLKMFTLIQEFDARRSEPHTPADLPVTLTEEEFWAIDFHIRRGHLDPSGARVGRELLLKVFGRLLDIRNAEELKRLRLADSHEPDSVDVYRRLRELRERNLGNDDVTRSQDSGS